jgi:hypothetical protein
MINLELLIQSSYIIQKLAKWGSIFLNSQKYHIPMPKKQVWVNTNAISAYWSKKGCKEIQSSFLSSVYNNLGLARGQVTGF